MSIATNRKVSNGGLTYPHNIRDFTSQIHRRCGELELGQDFANMFAGVWTTGSSTTALVENLLRNEPTKLPRRWRKDEVRWYLLWTQRWFWGVKPCSKRVISLIHQVTTGSRPGHCSLHCSFLQLLQLAVLEKKLHVSRSHFRRHMCHVQRKSTWSWLEAWGSLSAGGDNDLKLRYCFLPGFGGLSGTCQETPCSLLVGSRASPHNTTHFTGY